MEKAIIILSGGQDSTTCLLMAIKIYAQTKNIHNIIIGLAGSSIHPDCTIDFVEELQKTIKKATDYEINIVAPLINLKKSEIWGIADQLGYLEFVENKTYSCWNNQKEHCGECLSCKMRFNGLEEYKEKKDGK